MCEASGEEGLGCYGHPWLPLLHRELQDRHSRRWIKSTLISLHIMIIMIWVSLLKILFIVFDKFDCFMLLENLYNRPLSLHPYSGSHMLRDICSMSPRHPSIYLKFLLNRFELFWYIFYFISIQTNTRDVVLLPKMLNSDNMSTTRLRYLVDPMNVINSKNLISHVNYIRFVCTLFLQLKVSLLTEDTFHPHAIYNRIF